MKTTSKSVVANAPKILQVSLDVIDNLDWSDDDVSTLVREILYTSKKYLLKEKIDFRI